MSQTIPSTLVNTPKTNTSCGTDLSGLVQTPNQEVCGSTIYVGDVAAGVEAVQVDTDQASGVVQVQGAGGTTVSLSGQTLTISSSAASTTQWLPQLLDVIVATDESGRTNVPNGSVLQFNNNDPSNPDNGFWTATTVHDGGEY